MKQILDYARLAVVTFGLLILPVAGCAAPPLTPEQQAAHTSLAAAHAETETSLVVLAQHLERMEPGTQEHLAVSTQIVEQAQRGAEIEADMAKIDADAATASAGGLMDLLGMFVPGSELFEPAVLSLAPLAFKRPRKLFLTALKQVNPLDGKMAPAEAAKSILAGLGLMHSTPRSKQAAEADLLNPPGTGTAA